MPTTPSGARARLLLRLGLFLALLASACGPEPSSGIQHALGFELPLAGEFVETTFLDGPGTGTVYYLTGDEITAPRLTVRVETALGSLGERLEILAAIDDGMEDLGAVPLPPQRPINSTSAAMRRRILPLPDRLPELVLLVEFRVHRVEDSFYCFTWMQRDGDAEWLARWERAAAGIVIHPPADLDPEDEDEQP